MIDTVEVCEEGGMFTAYCSELDVASCGHTPEEAKKNLGEVIVIQLENNQARDAEGFLKSLYVPMVG